MSDERLAEIQARVDAARTPGPWVGGKMGDSVEAILGPQPVQHADEKEPKDRLSQLVTKAWAHDGDMRLMQHARVDIPDLLAEVRESRSALARVRGLLHEVDASAVSPSGPTLAAAIDLALDPRA